jgi:enamine deaminase RidA (YjgF/YER057c/UK114 family)
MRGDFVSTPDFITPAGVAAPLGSYSHMVVVPPDMKLLILAGQTGHAVDGSLPDDPIAQYRNALTNVLGILANAGAGPADIIKINTWLVGAVDYPAMIAIRKELLGDVAPASTMAYLAGLFTPDIRLEIEVMAAVPA